MSEKKLKSVMPKEAYQLMQDHASAILLDVRSTMEFLFVGHPQGAVHIAWIDEPDWEVNPNFVREVRELMLGGAACDGEGCVPVILICRSGKRSALAGQKLVDAGFGDVYNVLDGFEGDRDEGHHRSTLAGWRFENLPWEQC